MAPRRAKAAKAEQFRAHWAQEVDAAATYRALAERAEGDRREILLELAAGEDRHAAHWAAKLVELGEPAPDLAAHRAGPRARAVAWAARRFGTDAVLPFIERGETADAGHYDEVPEATRAMATDERIHARVVAGLNPSNVRTGLVRGERWHRGDARGTLRAAVFGINDGLVSNLALVMGMAGAGSARAVVLLAGLAGLLAGAFSMAAGEYVSVTSQRELFEREIALEAEELELMPEEETKELALIYRAKGVGREEAEAMAARIMTDRSQALDTMAREELGLNPDELGSPWGVAAASFAAFAVGAVVPVLPWLLASGTAALAGAVALAMVALFTVGAVISLVTGRSTLRSGLRQVLVGCLAAGLTYVVGLAVGVSLG